MYATEPLAPSRSEPESSPQLRILVVDDDRTNRLVLTSYLKRLGWQITEAANGVQAVERFEAERPDAVIMDVMMPEMDGLEATRRIKAMAGERFVPVIFLTAITDEKELARSLDCGGDDFLSKPYSSTVLRARIEALMRVRSLHETAVAQRDELERAHQERDREYEVAERLFKNLTHTQCLEWPIFRYLHSAQSVFNGDLLLAAPLPNGALRILVGDFTGHGLSAAVGAMPAAEVFYGMTAKGFGLGDVVSEINRKLRRLLPVGRMFGAGFLEIDKEHRQLTAWVGGIPDVLVVDGKSRRIKHRLISEHLPLTVVDNSRLDRRLQVLDIEPGDRIVAFSDGVLETRNPEGEEFGQDRLESLIEAAAAPDAIFDTLTGTLRNFRAGESQCDDVTLLEVLCDPAAVLEANGGATREETTAPPSCWEVSLALDADTLRRVDPLPQLTQALRDYQGQAEHWDRVYTILRELFTNAVDHGLLGLDSSIKGSATGFVEYYRLREERLAALEAGTVRITLEHRRADGERAGGDLRIRVEDSGPGFDWRARAQRAESTEVELHGRGIPLVRALADTLRFEGDGNVAEALYHWE
ncbi:MAG: fused response regulator/phosphatase [Ectothiorhodospiraceae bacterium]|nr:fused response regulator/phosphatase [Ectothiorhodospiraceae bacterium]